MQPRTPGLAGMLLAAGVAGLAAVSALGNPAVAAVEGRGLDAALVAGSKGDWKAADNLAANDGQIGRAIVEWTRLRDGHGDFADYLAFLEAHGDWPGLKLLRRRGESKMPPDTPPETVLAYFAPQPPQTGAGVVRMTRALEELGRRGEAEALAVEAWRTLSLGRTDQDALLGRYSEVLGPHHTARLDMLLWRGRTKQVERMLPLVEPGWRNLAAARMALRETRKGVDGLIAKVPAELSDDAGLAYERFSWRLRKKRSDAALELMLERSTSAEALGEPERWAERRRSFARAEMRAGNAAKAYRLAANHHLVEGRNYSDLEWLAGYIALRYLDDPALALRHFERFRDEVFTPISLGRAGYWIGRAHEALGQAEKAAEAYRFGGRYQTSFYGLLAAEKAGMEMDPALAAPLPVEDWREASFAGSTVIDAARIFLAAGRRGRARQFLSHLAETVPEAEAPAFAAMVDDIGAPHLTVAVGKMLAMRGIYLPASYFPLADLGIDNLPVARELALAIARRESEFEPTAISPAGARGLMQLMPATAREMAGELKLAYVASKLTADPAYNAQLGSAFLAQLVDEFDSAYAMVAAGYNAGASRPRRWAATYGDPRAEGVDPVDWVEHIPFRETRNYVMRVMEAVTVYRARLAGKTLPLRLSQELKGR